MLHVSKGDSDLCRAVTTEFDNGQRHTRRRGYLKPDVAVVALLLAIWQFTGTDVLWRTVATCVVVGAGTLAFSFVNGRRHYFGLRITYAGRPTAPIRCINSFAGEASGSSA